MQFGKAIGIACSSFAITNVDDMFVLVTFFAEASTSKTITPLKIILGQYLGFTIIIIISMIGYGASLVMPPEPIGFLGFLPILLGTWKLLDLLFPERGGEETENTKIGRMKGIFKVAIITVMNGGDNIGTYIPLFAQAKGAEIAVYVVVYYILLGVWCLTAFVIMRQRHVLLLVQKYVEFILPVLYTGLGIFIVVKSSCYPWSIDEIDESTSRGIGRAIMGVVTAVLLLSCIGVMLWFKMRNPVSQSSAELSSLEASSSARVTTQETLNTSAPVSETPPSAPYPQDQNTYEHT